MTQSSNQAKRVLDMCKARYPIAQIIQHFFGLNDWPKEHDLQLTIQQMIVGACEVDAAIEILMRSEFKCNLTFDFDEMMNMVIKNATASQALKALRKVHLSPTYELQSIVLSKGSHEQIIELKSWQLTPNRLEPKRFL